MNPIDVVSLIIKTLPPKCFFDGGDLMAFCDIESSFNANAIRQEPRLRDASYGLMQILFQTAHDRGYVGLPTGLLMPATNLSVSLKQLDWIREYLGTTDKSLIAGAWNAGVGNAKHGFVVQAYVDDWVKAKTKWAKSTIQMPF